ncbi:MAG TPA: tetratricopeptide repeat protein [Flavitalea sp.]|nr:tetratricopeptide repeat protein [Flavitalea sp.]
MEQEGKLTANKISKLQRGVRYAVPAIASVLLIFVCIEVYNFYRLTPTRLFNEKYEAYNVTTTKDSMETSISKAYREKKWADVINLNANSVLSVKDVFLTGMAFLETNNLSRAISSYQVVLADVKNDAALKDAAEYYLALAYLKNNDYDQAIELMNAIRNNSAHLYSKKFSRKYIDRVKRLKWR